MSRTNLALFERALDLKARGIPLALEGNIGAVLGQILDVYWLSEGEHHRIRDKFLQSFESLNSLEAYARDLDDFQVAGIVKVVREYARVLPDAVYDMMKISKHSPENQNAPGIILSTVHGAKGQEYDRVYIDPDLAVALSKTGGPVVTGFRDEANIAYVAFTRATRALYLPREFKDILTPEWEAAIERYENVKRPSTFKAPQPKPARRGFHGFSATRSKQFVSKIPLPEAPRKKPFKVGDRVWTRHGIGTVVEVNKDRYLVDLDGQAAHLWEKEWGLRGVEK